MDQDWRIAKRCICRRVFIYPPFSFPVFARTMLAAIHAIFLVVVLFVLFSVLTSAQGFTPFTNVLPMHAENCLLNHRLLVDLFSYVLAQSKYTYILDKCPVLSWIMLMTYGSLYLLLSILQTFSRGCAVQIWHILNSYIAIPVSSTTLTLSTEDVSSSGNYIGGGCARIARATVQPYISLNRAPYMTGASSYMLLMLRKVKLKHTQLKFLFMLILLL